MLVLLIPMKTVSLFTQKLGFSQIGYFKECGFKHDHWLDMVWLEKRINLKEERLNIINYRDFR